MNAVITPPDLERLRGAGARACGLLKMLANPDRLLLCQLSQEKRWR